MDGNAQKETCRAPAPGPDGFVPARPRVVLALAVLVLAGMAGFCLALYHSLTAVRPVDPADYPGAAPEGFRWGSGGGRGGWLRRVHRLGLWRRAVSDADIRVTVS